MDIWCADRSVQGKWRGHVVKAKACESWQRPQSKKRQGWQTFLGVWNGDVTDKLVKIIILPYSDLNPKQKEKCCKHDWELPISFSLWFPQVTVWQMLKNPYSWEVKGTFVGRLSHSVEGCKKEEPVAVSTQKPQPAALSQTTPPTWWLTVSLTNEWSDNAQTCESGRGYANTKRRFQSDALPLSSHWSTCARWRQTWLSERIQFKTMASKCPKCEKTVYFGKSVLPLHFVLNLFLKYTVMFW